MAFVSNSLNFPNLTSKASPTTSDILLISDQAASGALKQCTIGSLPSGTIIFNSFTVNFGTSPVYDSYFTITDAGVTSSSNILVTRSGATAGGQDADENELADFSITVTPGTGNFSLYLQCQDGLVAGQFTFYYSY